MNKHKEFIKKAYNGELGLTMCSEWKEVIEENYPEFKKTKLEVGKWYKIDDEDCYLINYSGNEEFNYGFMHGRYRTDLYFDEYHINSCELATKQEVQEALIKEAKRRGFKEGVIFKTAVNGFNEVFKGNPCFHDNMGFNLYGEDFNGCIFIDGKWAEIVETITKEEAEKKLGKIIV